MDTRYYMQDHSVKIWWQDLIYIDYVEIVYPRDTCVHDLEFHWYWISFPIDSTHVHELTCHYISIGWCVSCINDKGIEKLYDG